MISINVNHQPIIFNENFLLLKATDLNSSFLNTATISNKEFTNITALWHLHGYDYDELIMIMQI